MLFVKMPALLGDGVQLFKDTMDDCSDKAIKDNLRVNNHVELLSDYGYNPDVPEEPLWWRAVIDLPEPACNKNILRSKLWYKEDSGAYVLSIDILVKDAKFSTYDDDAEAC